MKLAQGLQLSWQTLKGPRKNSLSIILSRLLRYPLNWREAWLPKLFVWAWQSFIVARQLRTLKNMMALTCCSQRRYRDYGLGLRLLSRDWIVSLRLSHTLTNHGGRSGFAKMAWMGAGRLVPPLLLGVWLNMFQDYTFDKLETSIVQGMWNLRTRWRMSCCYLDPNLLDWCPANRRHLNLNRKHVLAFKSQTEYINLTGSSIWPVAIRAFSSGRFFMAQGCKISGQRVRYPWARVWGSPIHWKSTYCETISNRRCWSYNVGLVHGMH